MKCKTTTKKQLLQKLKNLQRQIKYLKHSRSQYKKQEERLRESEEKYRTLIENLNVGVYRNTGGPQGKFLHANSAIARMFGYGKVREFMKVFVSDLYQNPKERRLFVKEILKKGFIKNRELCLRKKDGTLIVASCTAKIQYDKKGKIKWIDGLIEDITKRKNTEKELKIAHKGLMESNRRLQRQSFLDSHTGLFNYRYLQDVIEVEFQRAKRLTQSLSVLMIDLDYFKSINDVYGHQFGDLILKQFARQLKNLVRKYDIVTRFGGEEFVIILPFTDKTMALKSARRIIDATRVCGFGNKECSIKLKLSIGVASYPENLVLKGINLINFADKNLNIAKEKGGNRIWFSLAEQTKKKLTSERKTKTEDDIHDLKKKIKRLTKRSNQSLAEAIFAFARTIKLKDSYTGRHVEQTVYYATEIARTLNLSSQELECIKQAAILHDLGKIGISEKILNKKEKLSQKEAREIKKHPVIAGDILRPIQFLHDIIPLILYHHERWDGKGYPSGLKGEEIPLGARIVALADVFQALISNRSYRQAFCFEEATKIIKKESGTKFDPKVAKLFLKILQQKNKNRTKRAGTQ